MESAELDVAQAGIKTSGRNINNLRYADDITLMAESKEELKSLLMNVKEESEKAGIKQHSKYKDHGIWSHQWQIDGRTVETEADFIFWAPKSLQMTTVAKKL